MGAEFFTMVMMLLTAVMVPMTTWIAMIVLMMLATFTAAAMARTMTAKNYSDNEGNDSAFNKNDSEVMRDLPNDWSSGDKSGEGLHRGCSADNKYHQVADLFSRSSNYWRRGFENSWKITPRA
ncbi:hypothetical protein AK812_SmicGene38209 [Symbiodinium microadriaticum]|uniref:Uncharacterized protein n=1 Tax=Symbiodinium microadriaticum TaxID=2951 RepID=A0A1Q9CEC7_SYMMI|nr:hypothetical protein AK812_SmicGene38209 [Symbiodinium microadriaticum]